MIHTVMKEDGLRGGIRREAVGGVLVTAYGNIERSSCGAFTGLQAFFIKSDIFSVHLGRTGFFHEE